MSVRLLALAASLREQSLNRRLLGVAASVARDLGAAVTVAEFREFDVPLFNQDLIDRDGMPPGAEQLKARLEQADGLLLASPEYNNSLPGTVKNLIDWVSRYRPVPLRGKSALLLATSSGAVGGVRGLWQLRIPLESLGVFVYPSMFALPSGRAAFAPDGSLLDTAQADRLRKMVAEYLQSAACLHGRPES